MVAPDAAPSRGSRAAATLLIFPPFVPYALSRPYLSLPLLAGYLRQHGEPADQRDLNADFFDYSMNTANLGRMIESYRERLDRLEEGSSRGLELRKRIAELICSARHLDRMKSDALFTTRLAIALGLSDPALSSVGDLRRFGGIERRLRDENPYHDFFHENFWPSVRERGYQVLGFSIAMPHQVLPTLHLARMCASRDPLLHIVLGGAVINLSDESTLERLGALPFVHSVVKFGGGKTLLQLISSLAGSRETREIPNLIDCTGPTPRLPARYEPAEIGESEFCLYDEKLLARYPEPRTLPIMFSSGCHWGRCTFCTYPRKVRERFQLKKPSRLVEEMRHLSGKHGVRRFDLVGECLPPRYGARVAEGILQAGLDLRFGSFVRIERGFTPGVVRRLARAGCDSATIGVESTCERILTLMGKGFTSEMILPQVRRLAEAGIAVTANIIVDFPTTTRDEALQVIRDLCGMLPWIGSVSVSSFFLERGTRVWERPGDFGIELEEAREDDAVDPYREGTRRCSSVPYREHGGMTAAERAEITDLYLRFQHEVRQRDCRALFWRFDPARSTWRPDDERLGTLLTEFCLLSPALRDAEGPGTGGGPDAPYCYSFLEDALHMIDERTACFLRHVRDAHGAALDRCRGDFPGQAADRSPLVRGGLERALRTMVLPPPFDPHSFLRDHLGAAGAG